MASRILAVIAAILLVATFALATLGPADISLEHAMAMMDPRMLARLTPGAGAPTGAWLWAHFVVPFLGRPVWMLPGALTLLCAGGAVTLASVGTRRSHHRRS